MTDEERVAKAITSLPRRLRRVYVMAHLEHVSFAEIAARLHLSQARVEGRLTRALSLCRAKLPDLEPPSGR